MLVLSIWLFLAGYAIAITGKRNLGMSYTPQADGSIKAVDDKGNPAQTFSLMDVIQCAPPSGSLQGQPAPPGRSQSSAPRPGPSLALPTPNPARLPVPNLPPIFIIPRPPRPGPLPQPGGLLGGLMDWEGRLSSGVYSTLHGVAELPREWLSGGRFHLPLFPSRPL